MFHTKACQERLSNNVCVYLGRIMSIKRETLLIGWRKKLKRNKKENLSLCYYYWGYYYYYLSSASWVHGCSNNTANLIYLIITTPSWISWNRFYYHPYCAGDKPGTWWCWVTYTRTHTLYVADQKVYNEPFVQMNKKCLLIFNTDREVP